MTKGELCYIPKVYLTYYKLLYILVANVVPNNKNTIANRQNSVK